MRYHLAYDSAHDQRVTAIFSVPKKFSAPFPAVILLAGSGGHKDTDYVRIAGDMMSGLGYATISIDAQYHGERSKPGKWFAEEELRLIDLPGNRDAWVQTVIDLRRALDFLQSRTDVDGRKIGYLGFSQGGMIGGTFIGVEPRVTMALLAVPGGGLVEWSEKAGALGPERKQCLELSAAIIDPVNFIGRFAGRPLLFCSAKKDELIPKFATDALFNAAKEPKEIKWYDSGHVLPAINFITDAKAFFVKYLGARQESKPGQN
jgi:dienelactone hydrolase